MNAANKTAISDGEDYEEMNHAEDFDIDEGEEEEVEDRAHIAVRARHAGDLAGDPTLDRRDDAEGRTLNVDVSDEEMASRRASWQPPAAPAKTGVLTKYAQLVSSASEGAVTGASGK